MARKSALDGFRLKKRGLVEICKKWKMRQRPKSFVFWSRRWESNPRPPPAKALKTLIDPRRFRTT